MYLSRHVDAAESLKRLPLAKRQCISGNISGTLESWIVNQRQSDTSARVVHRVARYLDPNVRGAGTQSVKNEKSKWDDVSSLMSIDGTRREKRTHEVGQFSLYFNNKLSFFHIYPTTAWKH